MSLDAGSVYTILGGRFNPAAFKSFDDANKRAVASAAGAESKMVASSGRMQKAHEAMSNSYRRAASDAARFGEALPLKAMDQWAKSSKQAEQNLAKVGAVARTGAAVGIVALGAATVYAATKATTFNREMLKIATQAGGSRAEVKALSTEVLKMAGTVPQGPQKLAEGLYHIESAGFRGAQAMSMLKASAQGAALGNASLENTTQAMIAATASQIKGVHGAADAMGQLNAIVGIGDMRMEQLAQAMATGLLPSAANAGLSLKDVGAALATVTDNATPANVTATRLRMTIALMASPSKAAAKELATIGMSSTQMAHDLRQPNGLLKAVEDLKTHLKSSGLTAEQQFGVLSKVFGGGRSSAVIQTLIAETDRLRTKYNELGRSDGVHKLAQSWAEFQKSEAAGFGELKSGAEGFAIAVGNVLMPELTKLARGGTKALQEFVSSGGAEKVAHGIGDAFSTIGTTIGDIAPTIEGVVTTLFHVAAAASSVGQSLTGLNLGGQLATIAAAFLAFKAASFVAPILMSIAAGISTIGLAAATAPSLAAFGGDLVALAGGPVSAIALALAAAAAGFVAIQSGLFSSTSAAERNAAALHADAEAVKALSDATSGAAKSQISAERATLQHKEAKEHLRQVEKEVADGAVKGAAATNALLSARLGVAESASQEADARKAANAALTKEQALQNTALDTIGRKRAETFKEIGQVENLINAYGDRNRVLANGETAEQRLVALRAKSNREYHEEAQAIAEVQVAEESRLRIQKGLSAITPGNALGISQLKQQLAAAGATPKIVTRYELDDQGAQAKLGALATQLASLGQQQVVAKVLTTAPSASAAILALRAIMAGVPTSKVIRILHNAPSARSAISQLHAAISAIPASKSLHFATNAASATSEVRGLGSAISGIVGKTVNIVVKRVEQFSKTKHASGRGTGSSEAALVGEGGGPEYVIDRRTGQGGIVDRPTVMGLGPDDYVVPVEDRYRGRALGLFAMLAKDLGVEGFKKGRGPAHHKSRPVPNAIDPLSLPLSDIEQKQSAAHSKYEHAATKVKSLEDRVHKAERAVSEASPKSRAKAQTRLRDVKSELAKARRSHDYVVEHRKDEEWKRTLREAKSYQARSDHETSLANVAANEMRLADGRNDEAGYLAAKGRRQGALGALRTLIAEARRHVKAGAYFDQLSEKLTSTEVEEQATAGEGASTGMTDAERAELAKLEAGVSLAALTPGLDDDKTAATGLVGFLERVLGEVQASPGTRGGDEAIKSIADQLKTARGNLASFSGTGTNENQDVQAQLEQEKQRRETAERTAQIAEGALAVFGGPGDIGAGARSAYAAAGAPHITIQTLHPADPHTLTAIGRAATAGIGYQGARRPVRATVGP